MSMLTQSAARGIVQKLAAANDAPEALPLRLVIEAICAVGDEARRRGAMFPQTSDEQAEDREAVRRIVGMLEWYERNTGCARIKGWPALGARP